MEERLHINESAVAGKPKIILPGDPPEAVSEEPTPVQIEQEAPIVVESIASPTDVRSVALSGLFLLAMLYSLYFARSVMLPITLALLFNFLLRPIVQKLERWHIPTSVSAALMLLLVVGAIGGAIYGLSKPAQEWLQRAPSIARDVSKKLQSLRQPFQKVTRVASQVGNIAQGGSVDGAAANGQSNAPKGSNTPNASNTSNAPQQVHVEKSILDSGVLSSTLSGTQEFIGNVIVVLILLYFLLASGDFFLRKMIKVIPRLSDKKRALKIANEMQHEISRYFLTVTIINACLGAAVGTSLYFIGMPAPFLWGATAFVLNFIPYLGALTGIVLTALVALISIDPFSHALLAPGAYLLIAILEGNFITPTVMGRRFTLNTVVIFAWLVFWGWLWGVPGALIAVPMLSMLKIFCDHIEKLHTLGEFLGNSPD